MHLFVYCSMIYNNQDTEEAHVSTDRWTDKEDMVYIYPTECYSSGVLLSNKKEWDLAICDHMGA